MKILQRMLLTWVIVMVTTIATIPNVHAQDQAAVVIIATGDFYAMNKSQQKRSLQRRSKVFVGDTISTGKNSRAQVRFIDGAVLSLRPESEMKIHKYNYGKSKAQEGSWMTLIKGGFRTITGAIGKKHYKVSTSMATIGIRGTHYEAVINDQQLYVALWDGGVTLSNDAGEVDLGLGADYNFGMVQSNTIEPQGQLDPPEAIVNDTQPVIAPDLSKDESGSTTTTSETTDESLATVSDESWNDLTTLVSSGSTTTSSGGTTSDGGTTVTMPTSGYGIYTVATDLSGTPTTGNITATGSTDSFSSFNMNATVNFASAEISGTLTATTMSAGVSNDWDMTFSGSPGAGSGVSGTDFSMSGTGLKNSIDPATVDISGTFSGSTGENMAGTVTLSDGSTTETGTFSAPGTYTP